MERTNTKQQIMDAAMELFSQNGYEATSISEIADAVGIRKASFYSHYESKQAILDAIIAYLADEYAKNSIFAGADWTDPAYVEKHCKNTSIESIISQVQWQIRYVLHNPYVNKVRKLLVLEQFRNQKMAEMLTQLSYTNIMQFYIGFMKHLIQQGILIDADVEMMAAQFAFPTSIWLAQCERDPSCEDEIMLLIERHVRQFFAVYAKK